MEPHSKLEVWRYFAVLSAVALLMLSSYAMPLKPHSEPRGFPLTRHLEVDARNALADELCAGKYS